MWYKFASTVFPMVFITIPIYVWVLHTISEFRHMLEITIFREGYDHLDFDFIVVGAGSAGCVISSRLSKNNKVLLLEAGGDPQYIQNVPAGALFMVNIPEWDWGYKTVPQSTGCIWNAGSTCQALEIFLKQIIKWPRGKSVGGSSNLNYMYYLRGHSLDYDNWERITNDQSWNFNNTLPYFKKSIVYNGRFADNKKHYGESVYGNLYVESRTYTPLRDEFIEAGKELGYDEIDANADQRTGFGDIEANMRNGARWGSYQAFIEPILRRTNLKISRYSHVTKIKLDKRNRATGVYYIQHGVKKFASTSKEIIVCAGAVDSPKLLMLSGIGPKDHLKKLKIKVKVESEQVGKNLQDHTAIFLMPITINQQKSLNPFRDFTISQLWEYINYGTGVFTNPSAAGAQAFISSSVVNKTGTDWPNLQLYIFGSGHHETVVEDFARIQGFNATILSQLLTPFLGRDGFYLVVTLVRPEGRGDIKLKDSNPFSPPIINFQYLDNEKDAKAMVEGIQLAVKLTETTPFQQLGAKLHNISIKQCDQHQWKSDAYWECYIRHFSFSLYHPTSTCSMGKVVDSRLKVIGAHGIRVGDASIMPIIPNANTNAPTVMIGEKAADFIREEWASYYEICIWGAALIMDHDQKCFYTRLT